MEKGMKLYYGRAKDLYDDSIYTCAFIARDDEVADKKARKYFNECSYGYEFEVNEQEIDEYNREYIEETTKDMKANQYYDTPFNYGWDW